MLAGLPVVPQVQLTTPPQQVAIAQSVSADQATPDAPQFNVAMAKAMTGVAPAILAERPIEQAAVVQRATAGPEGLPLSPSDQLAGAGRATPSAVMLMRGADATFGQVLVRAAISSLANPSAVPAFNGTAAPLPTQPLRFEVQASSAAATQSTGLAWSMAATADASTPKSAAVLSTVAVTPTNAGPDFAPMPHVPNRAQASTTRPELPPAGAVAALPVSSRVDAATANVMADAASAMRATRHQGNRTRDVATSLTAIVPPLSLTPTVLAFNGTAAPMLTEASRLNVQASSTAAAQSMGQASSMAETDGVSTPTTAAFSSTVAATPENTQPDFAPMAQVANHAQASTMPFAPPLAGAVAALPVSPRVDAVTANVMADATQVTPAVSQQGDPTRDPATSSTAIVAPLSLTPTVPAFNGTAAAQQPEASWLKAQASSAAAAPSTGRASGMADTAGDRTPTLASLFSTVAVTPANTESGFAPMAPVPNRARTSTTQPELPLAGTVAALPVSPRDDAITANAMADPTPVRATSATTIVAPLPPPPTDPSARTKPSAGMATEAATETKGVDQLNLVPVGQSSVSREVAGASAVVTPGTKDAAPTVARQVDAFASRMAAPPAPAASTTVMPPQLEPLPSNSSAETQPAAPSAPTESADAPNLGHRSTPTMAHIVPDQNAAGAADQAIEQEQARPIPVGLAAPVQVSMGLAENDTSQMAMRATSPSTDTQAAAWTLPEIGKTDAPALGATSQADQTTTPVMQTTAPVQALGPAVTALGMTQTLPLSLAAVHDATAPTPALPSIAVTARSSPPTDPRQPERPAQGDASAALIASVGPASVTPQIVMPQLIQAAPEYAATAHSPAPQTADASVQPRTARAGNTSESIRKTADDVQTSSAAHSPQEPNSTAFPGLVLASGNAQDAASVVAAAQAPSLAGMVQPPPVHAADTTSPMAAPSSSPASPGVASPAAQVAPAIVALTHAPDGTSRLTLRLDPPELGHVQIRIDRPQDAPARVEITVQRQETLTLLLRDQPQLQTALNQAGVPQDGRSITFHLATAEPAPRTDTAVTPSTSTSVAGHAGGNGSDAASRQGNNARQQSTGSTDDIDADFTPVAVPTWLRTGLDITA